MLKASFAVAGITGLLAAFAGSATAAEPGGTRVNYAPAASQGNAEGEIGQLAATPDTLTFSAPPRESVATANEIYEPIARYLSTAIGKKVVFRHSNNWLTYQTEMRKGTYDMVFDGAHFNGWRATNLSHNILAKVPGEHVFVVAVRQDKSNITELKNLNGRRICAMPPPNLGTLTVLSQFDNPSRQPVIVNTDSWENIYKNMVAGRCDAGIMPAAQLQKHDQGSAKVVFKGKILPNQAFSAGPRVTLSEQAKIARALTAPESADALAKLREHYAFSGGLTPASREEYAAFAGLLSSEWGSAN